MSEQIKTSLIEVFTDVQASRAALATQIDEQQKQLDGGKAQLGRFDALLAALQVSFTDEETLAAVVLQVETSTPV